ncbi:MAG: DUF1611 domain-containing protein [Cyclobacteriaceae bacterium]|nr:DUF1611 domain-containing protein [Cyclobacteriaceae bacterium]
MISGNTIAITGGMLHTLSAKTTHGLIRGSSRFKLVGVVDHLNAGKDAGEVLDGKHRNIPVFSSIKETLNPGLDAKYALLGIATKGGVVPPEIKEVIVEAIKNGLSIINGLHQHISTMPDLIALAKKHHVELIDVRKPKPFGEARFWNGDIVKVKCPKIAVLGTDCALGKRTTTFLMTEALKAAGHRAEMIYTGQTGWMQGSKYGFIFDATLNDFVSGEIEGAVVSCWENEKPDIMILEGQSSLRNPSGPCGSEFIISARLDGVILQHHPVRKHYKDMEYYPDQVATPQQEIALIRMLGAPTLAVTVNTSKMTTEEARKYQQEMEAELGIPVVLPLEDGPDRLVEICEKLINT